MKRYYFNFSINNRLSKDEVGQVIETSAEIAAEAKRALVEVSADYIMKGDNVSAAFDVLDEQGTLVYRVALSMTAEVCSSTHAPDQAGGEAAPGNGAVAGQPAQHGAAAYPQTRTAAS